MAMNFSNSCDPFMSKANQRELLQQMAAQQQQLMGLQNFQSNQEQTMQPNRPAPQQIKEKTMFQEIKSDVTGMIRAHRGVIYFVAFALLVDHFVFKGVFKARLQAIVEKLVQKVEDKVAA